MKFGGIAPGGDFRRKYTFHDAIHVCSQGARRNYPQGMNIFIITGRFYYSNLIL